jgi:hypothetical protein
VSPDASNEHEHDSPSEDTKMINIKSCESIPIEQACGQCTPSGDCASCFDTSSFILAVQQGNVETASHWLDGGVDIDYPDDGGRTALLIATKSNHFTLVRLLLDRGANIEHAR